MNLSFFFSIKLLFFTTLLGFSSPLLYAQTENSFEQLIPTLSQGEQFPYMTEQVLMSPPQLIQANNTKLVEALENNDLYRQLIENHSPLLTLEISSDIKTGGFVQFKVVKESFISNWGQELSAFASENKFNSSHQVLQEISRLLSERPYLAATPHDFVSAFSQTLDRSVDREEIFRALEHDDISILERVLDPYPEARGFKPMAFALESDREKEYYLDALREMMEANERMNQLFVTYMLAWQKEAENVKGSLEKYLIELTEEKLVWLRESGLQKGYIKRITNAAQEIKAIRRRIFVRIKSIEREIGRHQDVVTEHVQTSKNSLTLVEVHPSIGIFRGYIGGDCSSSTCFGYPYSSEERVFFILNKRGEDVGYLNGAMVNTLDGKRAFLVNGLAGARISKEMTTIIFAALSKSRRELGVEKVLLLGRQSHLPNLDYTEIRRAFDSHAGADVPIIFLDQDFRKIIDIYSTITRYDSPNRLSMGHQIENIEEIRESTRVITSERPFAPPQLSDFNPSDLQPRQKFLINLYHPHIAEEFGIDALKNPEYAEKAGVNLVEGRNLLDIVQNNDRLQNFQYMLRLESILNDFSFSLEETAPFIMFQYIRGLVSAPDFFKTPIYEKVIETLEQAIAKAKSPEDLRGYITEVFPYVRGKRMGEIVERVLDFVIESKNADLLEQFAHEVFPRARIPNKAEMIKKTLRAARALTEKNRILVSLAARTLPRIRLVQRKSLIEHVRSTAIALKDRDSLFWLGFYNNFGNEKGWQLMRQITQIIQKMPPHPYLFSFPFFNPNRLTTQDYEQQLEMLKDYFSLTPKQFFDLFFVDEIVGRILASDADLESNKKTVLKLIKEFTESNMVPIFLERLDQMILSNPLTDGIQKVWTNDMWKIWVDGMWKMVKRTIEVAIELQDHKTIETLEKEFFSKVTLEIEEYKHEFSITRDAIRTFGHDKNWETLENKLQTTNNNRSKRSDNQPVVRKSSDLPCFAP